MSNLPADKQLDRVRQSDMKVRQKLDSPKKISGWNVRKSNDGYYRCYRKIKSKVHCIYIGKDFNKGKILSRIAEKERYLGLSMS